MKIDFEPNRQHPSTSKDGCLQATGEKTLTILNIETGERIVSFSGHRHIINCSDFSFDGKYVLSGSGDNWSPYDFSVRIWDINSGKMFAKFKSNYAGIMDAKFSLDGEHVFILDHDHIFYMYSISQKKVIHTKRPQCLVLPTKGDSVGIEGKIFIDKELIVSIIDSNLVFWDWNSGIIKHKLADVYGFGKMTFNENECTVIFNNKKYSFSL
jgi:WD40 repeat protein